jgi:hypothetical protein
MRRRAKRAEALGPAGGAVPKKKSVLAIYVFSEKKRDGEMGGGMMTGIRNAGIHSAARKKDEAK